MRVSSICCRIENTLKNYPVYSAKPLTEERREQVRLMRHQLCGLVIDMQKGRFLDALHPEVLKQTVKAQVETLDHLRENGIPVVVLEYDDEGDTDDRIMEAAKSNKSFLRMTKYRNNGFEEKELNRYLDSLRIQRLLFMGINASWCVKETAVGAIKCNYLPYTARNLIANHERALKDRFNDTLRWFDNCGVYFDSHVDVLAALTANEEYSPQATPTLVTA